MRFETPIFVATFAIWSVANAIELHDETECSDDHDETAVLEILLDIHSSKETGWKLVCNEEVLWNVPSGSLQATTPGTWLKESSCLSISSNCTFTILDSGGDGLIGDGFFTFIFGAQTIAVSAYALNDPFVSNSFCFANGCTTEAADTALSESITVLDLEGEDTADRIVDETASDTTVQQTDINNDNDDGVECGNSMKTAVLDVLLHEDDVSTLSWQLICDDSDTILWNAPAGIPASGGEWVTQTSCIDTSATCRFTIRDAAGDGLNHASFFALRYGAATVAVSEYGASVPFSEESYCFGPVCDVLPIELVDEEVIAQNRTVEDLSAGGEPVGIQDTSPPNDSGRVRSTKQKVVIGSTVIGSFGAILGVAFCVVFACCGYRQHGTSCTGGDSESGKSDDETKRSDYVARDDNL